MNSIILQFMLPEILALLQVSIKNPRSLAAEIVAVTEVRDACNAILQGNGISTTPITPGA